MSADPPSQVVVDTSALMAILLEEPEARPFDEVLLASARVSASTVTLIELYRLAQTRAAVGGWAELDELIELYRIKVLPVDRRQLDLAKEGMRRFGKGRGRPPAVLNFGDLFAYALARSLGAPLLFKGGDFARTDVIAAWRP